MGPLLLFALSQTPGIIMSIKNSEKAEQIRLKAYESEYQSDKQLSLQQKATNQAIENLVARKQAIYTLFINDFVQIFGRLANIEVYNLQEKLNIIKAQKNMKKEIEFMNYGIEISKKSLSNLESIYSFVTGNIAYAMYKSSKYELDEARNESRMSRLAKTYSDTLRIILKGMEDKCIAVMNLLTPLGHLLKQSNQYIKKMIDEHEANNQEYGVKDLESITIYVDIAYVLESILVAPILDEDENLSMEIDRVIEIGTEQYQRLLELSQGLI